MLKINRTHNTEDICSIITLLNRYFKPCEMVNSNEILYHARNYSRLYEGEDYFIYKITDDDNIVACILGANLNEFVVIDYFAIEKQYRTSSNTIIKMTMDEIQSFNKPVVAEAETEQLCRLYGMLGFKRFTEPYEYAISKISQGEPTLTIETNKSNLLYLSKDTMTFNNVRNTLYFKHYLRWRLIYNKEFVEKYKKHLMKMIEEKSNTN